jgi:hypothetical protein
MVALERDLFDIYLTAGREVKYLTEGDERRPYWPNKYRQALQRAINAHEVPFFVSMLMEGPEPSRGFLYLKDAGRLDLSVEALVADASRPYHSMFSKEAVSAARARLAEHAAPQTSHSAAHDPAAGVAIRAPRPAGGNSFDIRVTVGGGGELTLSVI